jgi:tripartite ATP-independent transporter DctM subunit
MSAAVIIGFMLLATFGLPIAFAMGVAALCALWASGVDFSMVPQRMMHAVNSFPLMSIPFFMLAGELMIKAGIVERLIALANALVGRVRGGMAQVTMLSGAGLATVSGAAVSDASALSSILVPSLAKIYDRGFAAALVAAAANLGPIIPPSGAMIVYAFMAGSSVSVGGMFMAGVVPGLIITVGFMALCSWIATRRGWAVTGEPFRIAHVLSELRRSAIVLAMPVIVIGGIVGGAFTATEGAAIAVIYALAIGFFVTRKLEIADLPGIVVRAAITSAVVGALIAFASIITYLMTVDLLPQQLSAGLRALTTDPIVFLLLVSLLLFVVGMFLESNAAYIMLVPLLHPIALLYDIDPLHFGFLFVLNLVIGMLTPPVGVVLLVV